MVEAALVFPLVILTLFVLIYTMIFLFDQVAASAGLHRRVLETAGEEAGTFRASPKSGGSMELDEGREGLRREVAASKAVRFGGGMPGVASARRRMESRSYVINERKEIRLWDLFVE